MGGGKLRFLTAGESHGEMLVGILEGMPAGLSLSAARDIDPVLLERQQGYGRGRRQQIESDRVQIVSGVRFGNTTGAPIGLLIQNKDWKNWKREMSVEEIGAEGSKPVTVPRPGHADFAGARKYGHESDIRNVFERASARETAMRVAIGAVTRKLLNDLGIRSLSYVVSIGDIDTVLPEDRNEVFANETNIRKSAVRTSDLIAAEKMMQAIDRAKANGDSLGGEVEVIATGVPIGIGSHVHFDRKLDAELAGQVMSIQAVKSVEIGLGREASRRKGSEVQDPFEIRDNKIVRTGNNAGGIEGGMSNGETIVLRAAMKPISTLMQPLASFDFVTNKFAPSHIERSDTCAVPALAVIVEQVVLFVIASLLLEVTGGDAFAEISQRITLMRKKTILQ